MKIVIIFKDGDFNMKVAGGKEEKWKIDPVDLLIATAFMNVAVADKIVKESKKKIETEEVLQCVFNTTAQLSDKTKFSEKNLKEFNEKD